MATVHWIGTKRLAADTNAAGFLKMWRLPETDRLKAQALDKLALAPWRLSGSNRPPAATNYAALVRENPSASLVRALLDDLVQEEWYLEVRDAKEKHAQLALAIRLESARAGAWETNLAAVFEASGGRNRTLLRPGGAASGWQLQLTNVTPAASLARRVELTRAGEWTVIGFATEENSVFSNLLARVQGAQSPLPGPATNAWLETVLDLRRLSDAFSWGWELPEGLPKIGLAVQGDGQNVVTRGQVTFSKPLPAAMEPWNIPTNLIHEPVQSLTAARGLRPWLSSLSAWQNLHAGPPPDQLFCWAQGGSPFLAYAAAPVADASNIIKKLGPALMASLNPILITNRAGKWEPSTNFEGVAWQSAAVSPFVRSFNLSEGQFLLTGLAPLAITNSPPPLRTLEELLSQPNLIYFDREITAPRVEAWLFVGQLFRIIFRRAQLSSESPVIPWLKAVGPGLGNSSTTLSRTGPAELSLVRTSTCGLTALELHLLADWLESSEFPLRFHSAVAKLRPFPATTPASQKQPATLH